MPTIALQETALHALTHALVKPLNVPPAIASANVLLSSYENHVCEHDVKHVWPPNAPRTKKKQDLMRK